MESMGAIRVNQAFTFALLILTISVLYTSNNTPPSSASAYHFLPSAKFYLKFINQLRYSGGSSKLDEVMLLCEKLIHHSVGGVSSKPLDVQWIPRKSNWGFTFKTSWEIIEYYCEFHCRGLHGEFSAFVDTPKFQDELCGGRHCTWMFNDDGLFLYNLKDKRYHKWIAFGPPPNNGSTMDDDAIYSFRFRLENGNNNTTDLAK